MSLKAIIEEAEKLDKYCVSLEGSAKLKVRIARKTLENSEDAKEIEDAKKTIEDNELRENEIRNIRTILIGLIESGSTLESKEANKIINDARARVKEINFNPESTGEHERYRDNKLMQEKVFKT